MVVGDDVVNDGHLPMNQPNINGQNDDSMNQSSLEMMESIIQRLQPQNRHEIRDMIFHRGRISGAYADYGNFTLVDFSRERC